MEGVPDFKGQGQGQVKVKGQNGIVLSFKLAVYLYYSLCSVVSAEINPVKLEKCLEYGNVSVKIDFLDLQNSNDLERTVTLFSMSPLFDAKCLTNGDRYGHSYYKGE